MILPESALTPIRVLVADDHAVVRSSFRRLLDAQAGIEVVGEAANGREAVDASRRREPPPRAGHRAHGHHDVGARRHRGDPPAASSASPARVVILTTYDLDEYVFDALRAGGCGFLLKHSSEDEVVAAVRAAAAGACSCRRR